MPNQIFQASGSPARQNQGQSPFEQMMTRLAMANNMDWRTLLGFGTGRLLRGLFDDWKANYNARGYVKEYLADLNPKERGEALTKLEQSNPDLYQHTLKYLDKLGIDSSSTPQNTSNIAAPITPPSVQTQQQPEFSGVNPNARAVQQATQKLLGDTDFLKQRGLITDEPFKLTNAPWQDDANWNQYKWSSVDDALKSLRTGWQNGLRF